MRDLFATLYTIPVASEAMWLAAPDSDRILRASRPLPANGDCVHLISHCKRLTDYRHRFFNPVPRPEVHYDTDIIV